jgi:hypothetical protein
MGGIFILTGVLALIAIWVVVSVVPEEVLVRVEFEVHVEPRAWATCSETWTCCGSTWAFSRCT